MSSMDQVRDGIAGALHRAWCDVDCDSWDGQSCENWPNAEFRELANAAMLVVTPLLKKGDNDV